MNNYFYNNFKTWYKMGIVTEADFEVCLQKGALTSEQIEEIKNSKDN